MAETRKRKRILTGDRPTGKLHLGHYVGTLANRVRLQNEYDVFLLVADYHMLTTRFEKSHIEEVAQNTRHLVLDYLSVGIDPERTTIYVQSLVPEVAEIFLIFSMLVTVPRLQRVPTLKEMMADLEIENPSAGLLNYPVLQAADILIVRADLVPVGKDQESHIEVSREIARRFNQTYDKVFPIPEGLYGDVATLVGTDGKAKMSKSLNNAIFLSDDEETVTRKVKSMYTDPTRIRATDPGHVEGNPVFIYHDAFNANKNEVEELKQRYRKGQVGDVEVKQRLVRAVNDFLEPIRQRRREYEAKPKLVEEIIDRGTEAVTREGRETVRLMREAMGMTYFKKFKS
ncbi:tryptophan--tRNA ligase [candidate division KSB1 bacterium]|nr:tryptophan--tRNA ligase [candidate division KSB1 bacterium]NIR70661.1 tryptophan--tRNA ligase [candidate division KSB1 bacterium]NIS23149.1 tryptophan--tRNA ligase [candidate division KSB1 bacterium]NIT70010.1 tryptophan--tRNA ligase [candidate division KSB1 bacterium]NIU23647.1 tryptophan--tRNA ligase [candidate division KSB1 bacterium]